MESWPAFEAGFRGIYAKHRSFVLVFDLREMGIPDIGIVSRLLALVSELKVHSFRQLIAAVVLTSSTLIRDLIVAIVRRAGQAAPFYAYSSVNDAVQTAAYLAAVEYGAAKGTRAPACMLAQTGGVADGEAPTVRWKDLPYPSVTFTWIVMLHFSRAFGHVMQWAQRTGHAISGH